MHQNMDLDARRKDFIPNYIDQSFKDESRNSHFLMGHFKPNFNTSFQSQYQPNYEIQDNTSIAKLIMHNNISPSHKMGNDKVLYDTETHVKFISPLINKNKYK
jgi:hypothetical protein